METNFVIGDVVKSISGHDQNRLFIVVGIDKNGYIAIIDGKYRLKTKPKTKNPKHLKLVENNQDLLSLVESPLSTNAEIYKKIKVYKEVKE